MLKYFSSTTLIVWITTLACQLIVAVLLRRSGASVRYPAFSAFIYFYSLAGVCAFLVACFAAPMAYFAVFCLITLVTGFLSLGVAFEYFRLVYGTRMSLPRWAAVKTRNMVAGSVALALVLPCLLHSSNGGVWTRRLATCEEILAVSALGSFVVLVSYAPMIGITARRRDLAVAVGFLAYLIPLVAANVLRGHADLARFGEVARIAGMAGYLLALGLWSWEFRKRAPATRPVSREHVLQMLLGHYADLEALRRMAPAVLGVRKKKAAVQFE